MAGQGYVKNNYKYQAAAAANIIVNAGPARLVKVIVGKDVTGGIIEVSDHLTDGDGNVVLHFEDPNIGSYDVDMYFRTGIVVDMTIQTNVTFVYQ